MNTPTPTWIPFTPLHDESSQTYIPDFETVDVYEIALTICQSFENEARNKKIKLLLEADKRTTFNVQGNHADVALMLTQMIKNALAQTLEGFVKMRLRKKGDEILIEVNDSGIGIHPDEKIALVEVIYRGRLCQITHVQDPKTSMVLMANQLNSHNAKLQLSIQPGKGMQRQLALPIKQPVHSKIQFADTHQLSLTP